MTAEFENNIKNAESPIAMDLSYPDKPLLIAFGGMAGKISIPPFEFFNFTADLDVNKIYIRDLSQTWYHAGIYGITEDIDETAAFLKKIINESGSERVVVFGNSMGGYAAILFGVLIRADIVHAFVPQTFINNLFYVISRDKLLFTQNNFPCEYFDLKEVIQNHNSLPDINIYYDEFSEMDRIHAMHLSTLNNVKLHQYRDGQHSLVRLLRDSGELNKIIVSSLNVASPD